MEICDSDRLARRPEIRIRKPSRWFYLVAISTTVIVVTFTAWFLNPHLTAQGTDPLSVDTDWPPIFGLCSDDHDASHWVNGECVCRVGYHSQDGACTLNTTSLTARVVPVGVDHPVFPGPHGRVRTALCMSGGGARSLSIVAGSLRALEHLELMEHVDAISAVSGGAWAAAIYTFAEFSKIDLLGNITKPTDPSLLTMTALGSKPPQLGAAVTHSMWGFVGEENIRGWDEMSWIRFVANTILKHVSLDGLNHFLAASESDVEQIRRANPILAKQPFYTVQANRPKVLVIGGVVLSRVHKSPDKNRVVTLQMSPDFIGVPFHPFGGVANVSGGLNKFIGGGFMETFAFGGSEPRFGGQNGGDAVIVGAPRNPFSLAEAVGISSSAFASVLAGLSGVGVDVDMAPKVSLWPVTPMENQRAETVVVGDGGIMDNSGLLPVLQRKSSRIAWLINADVPLDSSIDSCKSWFETRWYPTFRVLGQLIDKFGFTADIPVASQLVFVSHNQVFAKKDFPDVLCGLQKLKKAGRPAVYKTKLGVLPNYYWGIEGNFDVDIVFVYNEIADDFVKQLPSDTRAALQHGSSGPFKNFPWFDVFQNEGELTKLTNRQVNLLAAHAEFAVMENKDKFVELFRPSWRATTPG
eukprot:TRINITY_DN12095_c0_g1_i1.p1 TRINITY_DN12095_c0_g1~~TRINITY_DN12095_c0_g1_i1.p1  ORF type:complete len:655 (+),score=98.89 TRINITY_DN12095_c0_g1_i1:57-1967(+)